MNETNDIVFYKINNQDNSLVEIFEKGLNRDYYCLFICINGNVKVQLEGKNYDLNDDDVCIYTPNRNIKLISKSENINGVIVGSSNKFIQNAIHSIFNAERVLYIRSNPIFHLEKEQRIRLYKLIETAQSIILEDIQDKLSNTDFHTKTTKALLESVCFYVMDLYSRSRVINTNDEQPKNARKFILNNFLASLYYNYIKERSVEFYCNQQGLTKRYFSTTIKAESGKSPKQWIEDILIEEIKHYLSNDNMTIKEIAYHFNFPNQSFFGKYFKQAVGMSPKEYRDKGEKINF